ncbi:23S rRNA (uridine2552-2'-O)-methyltransferase [Enhydrobacter aerosaccus]|uniref:Ribosomal RNA large subunit methyltransferase E n=1 Tax=Enhydrobacter aerosaccus TaxID=225324 RepID=A0A1T4M3G4_9HYPH|nr:RlmE family RNA methyltransferase [Enhydrobacter aerosaccus]SJZ61328.1 23S rRNA (uridine2552-2'-O)-methyltransferase [Enhydrobacter aerosaccus]
MARGPGGRPPERGSPSSKPTGRRATVRVKTARGRTVSSQRWLQRQLNDPYVAEAKKRGYRSRAAFKLLQLDDQFHFLKPGGRVVDLGAAPGGWTQVAVERVKAGGKGGKGGVVVGIDITPVEPIPGATVLAKDFYDDDAPATLTSLLGGPADVVLSDMAASATGDPQIDHLRIMGLAEAAHDFARQVLKPGGAFVAKVLRGGTERTLLEQLKRDFAKVRHVKPEASRADSAEMYVVGTGFRG